MEIGSDTGNPPHSRPSPLNGAVLPIETRFLPGQSGNPGGRPKAARLVSVALAELQDTPGETPAECIDAFKAARGAKLCGADHKAIALFKKENDSDSPGQVPALDLALNRLEGKVSQPIDVTAQVDLFSSIAAAHSAVIGGASE